jgi:hypothetical protein
MRRIDVDVIMGGQAVPVAEAKRVVTALQAQVTRDFAHVWNVSARIRFAGTPDRARPGAWQLALLDEADNSVEGYHELTREGLPLGRVYMRAAMRGGAEWSITASHELLELLVNPDATLSVFVWSAPGGGHGGHGGRSHGGGRIYSYEVCDPCQDDRFAYRIEGVALSDFVHPAWFDPWRKARSARFDHAEKLTRPFEVPKGCYATYFDARRRKWIDNWGGHTPPTLRPIDGYVRSLPGAPPPKAKKQRSGGSRKLLRAVPRPAWRRSEL